MHYAMDERIKKQLPLVCIVGPTASDKSSLGIHLAKVFSGEIISADSRQIYRGMDIGTDKALPDVNQDAVPQAIGRLIPSRSGEVVHWLLDIADPEELYTLAQYQRDALHIIPGIIKRGRVPFLVGGTGLYVAAVVDNFVIPKGNDADQYKIRAELDVRLHTEGLQELYRDLCKRDTDAAWQVDGKNPRRVIRALEVCILTGKPFTQQKKQKKSRYDVLQLGIITSTEEREKKIRKRVQEMIAQGFAGEVQKLITKDYDRDLPSMTGIGYKEIGSWLSNGGSVVLPLPEEVIEGIVVATLQYAKRQMTWFKRDKRIHWVTDAQEAEKITRKFLQM